MFFVFKMIGQIENRIHKIKARYETSITINERYQKILEKFEEVISLFQFEQFSIQFIISCHSAEQLDIR